MRLPGKFALPVTMAASMLALSACSGVKPSPPEINSPAQTAAAFSANQSSGQSSGGQSSGGLSWVFGKGTGGSSAAQAAPIQVNAYLWRASLDTLSFMPLVSADPFGGVIITDWYSPPSTPDERFKVNAYILSKQLTASAVQVSVFHQVQNGQGWVDAPVDPAVANGLENRILARAADLKAAARNTK